MRMNQSNHQNNPDEDKEAPVVRKFGGLKLGAGLVVFLVVSGYLLISQSDQAEEAPAIRAVLEQRDTTWETARPEEVGLKEEDLKALADLVEGAGVVVRHGKLVYRWGHAHRGRYVASVKKSIISVLNWQAVEQGLLDSIDDPVAEAEPRLLKLNEGNDASMTWRHLACMISGYGLEERPGEAFAYNDYAVKLWYDSLMKGVYKGDGTEVLRRQLGEPLGFEDGVTFKALGEDGPEPKLRISARDLARFAQMMLGKGQFAGRRVLAEKHWQEMVSAVVPVDLPMSSGRVSAMLPGAQTVGGSLHISPIGPGRYTFHLWKNLHGPNGRLMLPDAPVDTIIASGKWGESAIWILPSLDMVVVWNDSDIGDHHVASDDPEAKMNQAARLIVGAARTQE
jgi:CubicO group peptidase (beta-lactamase class C family)